MHLLTLTDHVPLAENYLIEAGVEMITEDVSGANLLVRANGGMMKPLAERRPFDDKKDWNGKRILFVRFGGFGDLIRMTPVFREIIRRWPGAKITVATIATHYGQVLQNLLYVHEIISYPIPYSVAEKFDAWVFFEKAIENNPRAQKIHMTDLFAEITGLTPIKEGFWKTAQALADYKAEYQPTADELTWAKIAYPRVSSQRRLCIQIGASAKCRMYPTDMTDVVIRTMHKKGWEVFLMDEPGKIGMKDFPGLKNLSAAKLTFRQSAAVIAGADCVLAPDSALLHVAGALGIPAVGLYGPFPAELRTKYDEHTRVIQGSAKCAPCFHHATIRHDFPVHCPTGSKGICGVLASITPERVVTLIEATAKKLEVA